MNNRFIKIMALVASSVISVSGCGDTSTFETPNTSGTTTNNNTISQKNFTILFSPVDVQYEDQVNGGFTAVTAEVSVQIGDNNNQLITGNRTIVFRTEWGLIDPSCITEDGGCSVTWRSGSPGEMPANLLNNIVAYSSNGQETFLDVNGNGLFDDGDSFDDLDEPFVDINENGIFDTGDLIIDTINGLDLTGADTTHNNGDGLYNGPNCSHSSLCSTTLTTTTVWRNGSLGLTTDPFTIGGTISGLTGTVILQNRDSDDLTVSANGAFTFATSLTVGTFYSVTVKTDPVGQTCNVTAGTGTGIVTENTSSVVITCSP